VSAPQQSAPASYNQPTQAAPAPSKGNSSHADDKGKPKDKH
jgi:hypothetical protein